MALQPTVTVQYYCVGAVGGSDLIINSMTAPANSNAPPPSAAALAIGANSIVVPSGYTVTVAFLRPPASSTNAKTLKGVTGDTGLANWTNQPLVIPVAAGETFLVVSASAETLEINWG